MGLLSPILLYFQIFAVFSHCPQWRCKPLSSFTCAEWTPTIVWVNVEPCPDGLTCSLLDLLPRMTWSPSGVLRCSEPFLPHNSTAMNCGTRNEMAGLIATHPHACVADTDCQQYSGGLARCACGLDSTSYCRVSEGDSELNEFYSTCSHMPGEMAFAWYLFIDLGHMLPRTPWCVKSHFEEIDYLRFFLTSHNLGSFLNGAMSGDNKLFTAFSSSLFSPASLTKKSPKQIRYDPISHERIVYSNETGVMRQVSNPAPSHQQFRSSSRSVEASPFRNLNNSVATSTDFSVSRPKGMLAQSGIFSLSSSPSLSNVKYAKTRTRADYTNPITGATGSLDMSRDPLESLGGEHRVLANRSRFASSGDLRNAYDLSRGQGEKIAGAKRMPVQSVAYVNLFDLRS